MKTEEKQIPRCNLNQSDKGMFAPVEKAWVFKPTQLPRRIRYTM